MLKNTETFKQQLNIYKLITVLMTLVGVFGGIILSNPTLVKAQTHTNLQQTYPDGAYSYSLTEWSQGHKGLLTQRPADFINPEVLWKNYNMTNGSATGEPSRMLKQQVFVKPVPGYKTAGDSVIDFKPLPVAYSDGNPNTADYTGMVTNPSTGEPEFQIIGTAVPYRWFHTTALNHTVAIITHIKDKSTGEEAYRLYPAKLQPWSQTRRYQIIHTDNSYIKNTNEVASALADGSDINGNTHKYFQDTYGSYTRTEVSRLCGLGIRGARQQGSTGTTSINCNYRYDYAGFEVHIPIREVFDGFNKRNALEVQYKIAIAYAAAPGRTNYITAPLDILTDIQAEYPIVDDKGYEEGSVRITSMGSPIYNANESSIRRNPYVANNVALTGGNTWGYVGFRDVVGGGQLGNAGRVRHPMNPSKDQYYQYNKKVIDKNLRGFPIYENLDHKFVWNSSTFYGNQFGWYQGWTTDYDAPLAARGHAYSPSEYFYTSDLTIKMEYIPNPIPSENVQVHYVEKGTNNLIPEFTPNPEIVNITEPEGTKEVTVSSGRETVNRGGKEWQLVPSAERPATVTLSYANPKDIYFEYEPTPDPQKNLRIYYTNILHKGKTPTNATTIKGITPNPETLPIVFRDTITHTNKHLVVEDTTVPRRRWKFEEGAGNPISNTFKYDVGVDGVYNTLDPNTKGIEYENTEAKRENGTHYYYTQYDDVLIRYLDADSVINNPTDPSKHVVIYSKESPRLEELAFGDTLTVEGEDQFTATDGSIWQLVDDDVRYPRVQTRTNDDPNKQPEVINFLYRNPYNVNVEHREILSDGNAGKYVNGRLLESDAYNLRLDRYAILDAREDGTIAGSPGHEYVGLISVDGGTTILKHDPRQVEMLITKGMNNLIFYYAEPISNDVCDITTTSLVSCVPTTNIVDRRPDIVLPYVNGYLTKLGEQQANNAGDSSYVYNYVPRIEPRGVYAVRAVNVRGVGGGEVVTSTNSQSPTYVTSLLNDLKAPSFLASNIHSTRDIVLSNAPNARSVSELSTKNGKDMSTWSDGIGVSLILDSDNINRGPLGDVEFTTSYKYIDTIRHNYEPTLVHDGQVYMARYVDTTLDYSEQKSVEFTTVVEDAGHDYGESFGNAGTSEFMYAVGFEREPIKMDAVTGVIETNLTKYYEIFSNAYDAHTQEHDTQRAVEVSNKFYYANMLYYADLPYMNLTTRSNHDRGHANILTFDKDNMWYLVGAYDEQNPTLDKELIDIQTVYNATTGQTLEQFLNSKVEKRFNTTIIPDTTTGDYFLEYNRVLPLVYGGYTEEDTGQSLDLITKDIYAAGSDSGYQVVVKDARTEPTAANWREGWKDVDVYTGEQYGKDSSIRVLTNRNVLVNALTTDLGLTHSVSASDKLVTKGRGSLYFLPVDIKLNDVEGNDKYHNRTVVTDLGLNDATYVQDDMMTVDKYLFGRGNDVIYSPQRLEIEEGKKVESVDVLVNRAALNDYKNIDNAQWKTSNGTRMVYGPVLDSFITSAVRSE